MDAQQIIAELRRYENELGAVLSHFTASSNGLHIRRRDDPLFRQYARELLDLFNDVLGQNSYSRQIAAEFNDGISLGAPTPGYARR